jgi:transposase
VCDACEVYDGVPSMHDAKAAQVIGRLYFEGASRVWGEASEQQRSHDAIGRLYRLYQKQHQQQQNRLEAALQRHWPELTEYLELDSVTLEDLLLSFGCPAELSARAEEGRERMRRISRGKLAAEKIEAVLESARQTIGVPCVAAEREYLMALGAELRHSREQKERVGLRLSALTQADPELHALSVTLGRVTTGLLIAEGLDPRAYTNSGSYCKALGLNLKERSSGQHKGQIKITKRGSGLARRDLYLATLRLINHNGIVNRWYEKKVQAQDGRDKLKIVVALMRKLSRALWYVARGQAFDARRLCAVG